MVLSKRAVMFIVIGAVVVIASVGTPFLVISILNNQNKIEFTLLDNAGIMIESEGVRIYIDPYNLPTTYSNYPADAIFVTHPHLDHYSVSDIDSIRTNDTIFVCPKNMTEALALYDGIGVNPEDQVEVGHIKVTAFYMYTFSLYGFPASHPVEANYTSFYIEINGFTIFHAGDSKNIAEYNSLPGKVDLALLPLGPGCQTMTDSEIISALSVIDPNYFTPIHYEEANKATFLETYGSQISCQIINLDYFSSYSFK